MSREFRLVATGDSLVSQDPLAGAGDALLRLIRSADVAFTNLEGVVCLPPEGIPSAESGGTWVNISPRHAEGLRDMGFTAMSTAHNHALDWGHAGILAQSSHLDALGIAHAGAGHDLAAAQAPAYVDGPRGRTALVAATTSFHNWNRAGASRRDCQGRPGIAGLRLETELTVTADDFAILEGIVAELGLDAADALRVRLGFLRPREEGTLTFRGTRVRAGQARSVSERLNPADVTGVLDSIREAARQAERVIFSIHCHQMDGGQLEVPPAWLRELCVAAVEAGADVVLGHGPHVLRGIEIIGGRPVFYSLGNFIFQNETVLLQPADQYELQDLAPDSRVADVFDRRSEQGGFAAHRHYWETVAADVSWHGDRVSGVRLHPLELGFGEVRSRRGNPRPADAHGGQRIIADLAALSAPFGTEISWNANGFGEVRLWPETYD